MQIKTFWILMNVLAVAALIAAEFGLHHPISYRAMLTDLIMLNIIIPCGFYWDSARRRKKQMQRNP